MTERIAWIVIVFLAGFAFGYKSGVWRGIEETTRAESANAELVRFAEAAQDANGWDYIFNKGK